MYMAQPSGKESFSLFTRVSEVGWPWATNVHQNNIPSIWPYAEYVPHEKIKRKIYIRALWSRTNKNPDVDTGPVSTSHIYIPYRATCSFTHSFACTTHLFAYVLTHLLPSSWDSDWSRLTAGTSSCFEPEWTGRRIYIGCHGFALTQRNTGTRSLVRQFSFFLLQFSQFLSFSRFMHVCLQSTTDGPVQC